MSRLSDVTVGPLQVHDFATSNAVRHIAPNNAPPGQGEESNPGRQRGLTQQRRRQEPNGRVQGGNVRTCGGLLLGHDRQAKDVSLLRASGYQKR